MKRVRCPKCDNYITFDETQYKPGQQLVFECHECHKQFGVRIGTSKIKETQNKRKASEVPKLFCISNMKFLLIPYSLFYLPQETSTYATSLESILPSL